MDEVQFVCAACEKEYEGDLSNVMTECRVCSRLHCSDCVDEYQTSLQNISGRSTRCCQLTETFEEKLLKGLL